MTIAEKWVSVLGKGDWNNVAAEAMMEKCFPAQPAMARVRS
jgi:hypothetical protein